MPLDVEHEDLSEAERDMMHFMAKRLGFDHFIFAGYDSVEFSKHILSKGLYEYGAPKIGMCGHKAGLAYMIARMLCDFPFSYELRRAVHSIINTVETRRQMKDGTGHETDT